MMKLYEGSLGGKFAPAVKVLEVLNTITLTEFKNSRSKLYDESAPSLYSPFHRIDLKF